MACLIKTAVLRLSVGVCVGRRLKCLIGDRHVGTLFWTIFETSLKFLSLKGKHFLPRKRSTKSINNIMFF